MLRYPDLILTAQPGVVSVPKWLTVVALMKHLQRTNAAYYAWMQQARIAAGEQPKTKKFPGAAVPPSIAAYTQLLAGTHPKYTMSWLSTGEATLPPLVKSDKETLAEWRREWGVSAEEIAQAFALRADLRSNSPHAIGNDAVRWIMLRLMAGDKRCGATVHPRAAITTPTHAAEVEHAG